MTVYIALLRGINVGGRNIIKMAQLKSTFEEMGFSEVKTYIQSGNVVFKSGEDENILKEKIQSYLEEVFGFKVSVVLRTGWELEQIVLNQPFQSKDIAKAKASTAAEVQYVALLDSAVTIDKLKYLDKFAGEGDSYQVRDRDIYLLFHHSIRDSRLAVNLNKLDVPMTVRNWNTMNKLNAMAKDMENSKES